MRNSESLNLGVLDEPPTPWGGEDVTGPESIFRLLWVAAASREVGRFVRVVYRERGMGKMKGGGRQCACTVGSGRTGQVPPTLKFV